MKHRNEHNNIEFFFNINLFIERVYSGGSKRPIKKIIIFKLKMLNNLWLARKLIFVVPSFFGYVQSERNC